MITEKDLIEIRNEARADLLAEEAKEKACLSGGRDLYRVLSGDKMVAFISSYNADRVHGRYLANGGKSEVTNIERITFGYPEDTCKIYA